MKKTLFVLIIALLSNNMFAQQDSAMVPPQQVSVAFSTQFPTGRLKKWEQRNDTYIAIFRKDGKKYAASYTMNGSWKNTEILIKWTKNLPESVKKGWENSEYIRWYVEDIRKIVTPGQLLYVLHVNNGVLLDSDHYNTFKEEQLIYFSEKGELIKAEKLP